MKNTYNFTKYSSKVKRVNVPLPSFNYVHKSWMSNRRELKMVGFLIGRDRIIEKLKSWLTKEKTDGGSYLITGYRGMGKTCFVDNVIYELVAEASLWDNMIGFILYTYIAVVSCLLICGFIDSKLLFLGLLISVILCGIMEYAMCKRYVIKEMLKKNLFCLKAGFRFILRHKDITNLGKIVGILCKARKSLSPKEWARINHHINGINVRSKRYSHISVNINLGQEILDERSVLCVLTSQLHDKYKSYILSPIANAEIWMLYVLSLIVFVFFGKWVIMEWKYLDVNIWIYIIGVALVFVGIGWHQLHTLLSLSKLSKRINAKLVQEMGGKVGIGKTDEDLNANISGRSQYTYPIASTRDIESQLIAILDRIDKFPAHPTFYFIFDELDKIETPIQHSDTILPEFTNEKYLTTGGTSRKRKLSVMHLLANMKFFTSTAKAKFIFIAGREMYDGYLADLTDRESAISSLFNGVIYVDSFCKNEKSERDVMYNAETFISRQLIPRKYIEDRVIDYYIECKLLEEIKEYNNIDINLKMYYEYLIHSYTDSIFHGPEINEEQKQLMNDVRICVDKTICLLYHFSVYLYHLSNGSPKKMKMAFESFVRPLKNTYDFHLKKGDEYDPLEGNDVDIHIPHKCRFLLTFNEKDQRKIGFIHYISFPVNQIITASDQFGDKLLVSASFLINHIYKHHSGGFSWRNIEQTPELLEVYKIPEFRSFINSILGYLLQTHIIQIPCGLYQYKFRKQISEEISLASKVSEEISALFNFTLDESQSVKCHYYELLKSHLSLLKEEKTTSPHSIAGIHHILGDLYLEDEEYNNAVFEFQTAIQILQKDVCHHLNKKDENPHFATLIQAYIRIMLKLGLAFEKRRTYSSAYNTYNEVINRLFRFRELEEGKYGYKCDIKPKEEWPHYEALLYKPAQGDNHHSFKTKGNWVITDFSYHMSPENHSVIQRLSMLEDTRMVYQALLAKLFINEKIELGGITRMNLDTVEGEFRYIHLTTNIKQKFLISTDFFRRIGDIMFYKNGLIGFNYSFPKDEIELNESLIDSLYYWGFNIRTELSMFCKENKCYELYGPLLKASQTLCRIEEHELKSATGESVEDIDKINKLQGYFVGFWRQNHIIKRINKLCFSDIENCKNHRKIMWKQNKPTPCYACKYYNRSLKIITKNLFGVELEKLNIDGKRESKTITILRQIVIGGSAKSMRQNYMIQMAEVLDCLGNTMLSCSCFEYDKISSEFLAKFLHDVHEINSNIDQSKDEQDTNRIRLLKDPFVKMSKLETVILYFWEASVCFRYGREMKKASGSMKKILRVLQNYMRVAEGVLNKNDKKFIDCKILIGEYINEIKNRLVKQCLICLYTHYDFINLIEIQRLKWIFYIQMYENISLSRLSLFPDVEEIMLIYYDLIRLCYIDDFQADKGNDGLVAVRKTIDQYSRTENDKDEIKYSWDSIKGRNKDFNKRLIGIYNNLSMGSLRNDNTMYERVLSLRAKTQLNAHILHLAFPCLKEAKKYKEYVELFCHIFTNITGLNGDEKYYNKEWKEFFPGMFGYNDNCEKTEDKVIDEKLHLMEFLIRDSIYCLTSILESITPHNSTTLFTNSFMGNIYSSLNYWNTMFDALYVYYKVFDENWSENLKNRMQYSQRESYFSIYDEKNTIKCDRRNNDNKECVFRFSKENNEQIHYCYLNFLWKQENSEHKDGIQTEWKSRCPYYEISDCQFKKDDFQEAKNIMNKTISSITGKLSDEEISKEIVFLGNVYRKALHRRNLSDRFFGTIIETIGKPNIQYTLTNYSGEMALKSYRLAKEINREGKAYKEMISKMYFLDDDLKNDTIQFDLAIERFKINSKLIDNNIKDLMHYFSNSIYDIECFCTDNETRVPLSNRFLDVRGNISQGMYSVD